MIQLTGTHGGQLERKSTIKSSRRRRKRGGVSDNDSGRASCCRRNGGSKGGRRRNQLENRLLKIWLQSYSVMCPISNGSTRDSYTQSWGRRPAPCATASWVHARALQVCSLLVGLTQPFPQKFEEQSGTVAMRRQLRVGRRRWAFSILRLSSAQCYVRGNSPSKG